jgi:hypothetical protein
MGNPAVGRSECWAMWQLDTPAFGSLPLLIAKSPQYLFA